MRRYRAQSQRLDPEQLRNSEALRESVANEADAILKRMQGASRGHARDRLLQAVEQQQQRVPLTVPRRASSALRRTAAISSSERFTRKSSVLGTGR